MGPGKVFNLIAQYLNEVGIGTLASLNVTGATITGTLSTKVPLSAVTSGVGSETVLTNGQTGHLITNTGASAKASCKLPASPAAGTFYDFLCDDADGFRVVANTGQTISLGGLGTSASAGYVETVRQFSAFRLTYTATNTWVGTRVEGTWRKDSTSSAGYAFTPTEWITFTPSGSWVSNTTYAGSWQQVGRTLYARYLVTTTGAPTSAVLTVELPSGFLLDGTAAGWSMQVGYGAILDSGTSYRPGVIPMMSDNDTVQINYSSASTTLANVTQAAPQTFANGDVVAFIVEIPVA